MQVLNINKGDIEMKACCFIKNYTQIYHWELSPDKIKQELVKRLEDLEYQAQSIQRDIARTNKKLIELDSCEDLNKFWF